MKRKMRKNQTQLAGCNRHNITKPSKADMARINQAYNKKIEEYTKLNLEELEALQETKLSHTYKIALENVIFSKKHKTEVEQGESVVE